MTAAQLHDIGKRRAWVIWLVGLAVYALAVFHRSSLGVAGIMASERFDINATRLALFTVLRPGLGLAALVGSSLEVPLSVDAAQLLLVLLWIVGIVVFGMVVAAALQRATVPATAVLLGFE